MPDSLFHATTLKPIDMPHDNLLVHRSRMLRILDTTPNTGMLTWIIGPIGAGKSTIAQQWATALGTDTQVISVRKADNGPSAPVHPPSEFGIALQDLLNICARTPDQATESEIAVALDRVVTLSHQHDQPLILDDLELIQRDALNTLLRLFAEALPKLKINRALLISRTMDTSIMRGLQAYRSLRVVLPTTLEFDAEESAEAHRLGVFGSATLEEVERTREESAGWITGMLAHLYGHGGSTISPAELSSHIINNMMLQQPLPISHVIFASSILPENSIEIWEQWFFHLDLPPWAIPSTLSQLPTRLENHNNDNFNIVPSMRHVLSRIRRFSVSEIDILPLMTIAMDWYIRQDAAQLALSVAIQQGLETEYLKLIKPKVDKLSREENWSEIDKVISELPIDVILEDFEISYWYGFSLTSASRWSDMVSIYNQLADRYNDSKDALVSGRLMLVSGFIERANGNYNDAKDRFETAFEMLPPSAHQDRMYAAASAGTSASQIRLDSSAFEWIRRAAFELAHLPQQQRWWHSNSGPIHLGYLASAGFVDTAHEQANRQVQGLIETYPNHTWRYLYLMARIEIERRDFAAAEATLERVRPYLQSSLQQTMLLLTESNLLAARGEYPRAMALLDNRPLKAGQSINNDFQIKLTSAAQAFDAGNPVTAEVILGGTAWPTDSWPRNFGDTHPNLIRALIRAETEHAEAIQFANDVLSEAKYRNDRYLEIRSHVVLAYIYHQMNDLIGRDRELRTATERNATAGYQLIFFVKGVDLREGVEKKVGVADNNRSENVLTSREIQILSLVAQSFSNKQIAEELYISVSTVKNHLASIYDKLNTNNRRAAVEIARKSAMIPD